MYYDIIESKSCSNINKETIRQSNHQQKTIYIVDDYSDDRFFCKLHLQQSPWVKNVKTFCDAQSLFEYFDHIGIYNQGDMYNTDHLVLLDIHMPQINGIEVLDYIRNHPITSDMPVILLSSDTSPDKIYDAYKLEATEYLQKPFSVHAFNRVLINTYSKK